MATALGLRPEDWEKPSFHRRGIIPVHENVTRRVQEIAIHGWDIRSAFDPAAEISEAGAQEIATVAHRWLGVCFVPLAGGAHARFRFEVSGPNAFSEDVVLEGDTFRIEAGRKRSPRRNLPRQYQRLRAAGLRPPGHKLRLRSRPAGNRRPPGNRPPLHPKLPGLLASTSLNDGLGLNRRSRQAGTRSNLNMSFPETVGADLFVRPAGLPN